jgi:hypothetical protein
MPHDTTHLTHWHTARLQRTHKKSLQDGSCYTSPDSNLKHPDQKSVALQLEQPTGTYSRAHPDIFKVSGSSADTAKLKVGYFTFKKFAFLHKQGCRERARAPAKKFFGPPPPSKGGPAKSLYTFPGGTVIWACSGRVKLCN